MLSYNMNFDLSEFDSEFNGKLEDIGKAVISASLMMKERARQHMRSSHYHLNEVAEGILVGTLKKARGKKNDPSVKLHAFGNRGKGNLARIFVGGTVYRFTRNGKNRGYVQASNSIEEALDQSILDSKINEALK